MSDYKRNPRGARRARKSLSRKALVVLSLMMVLVMAAVGGTIAWLTDSTDTVTNTFTVGDVDIELSETFNKDTNNDGNNDAWQGKMVPGNTLTKDPAVTVTTNSEDVWLFVKLEKSTDFDVYLSYEMATGWTALSGVEGVYYYTGTITKGTAIPVLKDNEVHVSTEINKSEMATLKGDNAPTLKVTAYACQLANVNDAATAWSYIGNNGKTPAGTD